MLELRYHLVTVFLLSNINKSTNKIAKTNMLNLPGREKDDGSRGLKAPMALAGLENKITLHDNNINKNSYIAICVNPTPSSKRE